MSDPRTALVGAGYDAFSEAQPARAGERVRAASFVHPGLTSVRDERVTIREPEGEATFHRVLERA